MTPVEEIRRAYDDAGQAWSEGPSRVYRALAQPVLDLAGDVAGTLALDVGTGSGVLADELVRRGARVMGFDFSFGMLRWQAQLRPPAAVADVGAMPVAAGSADLVTAAFVLNHLDDPVPALRELCRVLKPGGRLLATTFEGDAAHPAKGAVDEVLSRFGHVVPPWYRTFKATTMPALGDGDRFAAAVRDGGFAQVQVVRIQVGVELTPAELVGWRLGMPHAATFVAGLPATRRAALTHEAERAVKDTDAAVELVVLLASATA